MRKWFLDKDGNPQENIIEKAHHLGKAIGLVSDTRIIHATPAAFAAHRMHRSQENTILEDLLATGADVMLSGGLSYWLRNCFVWGRAPLLQGVTLPGLI